MQIYIIGQCADIHNWSRCRYIKSNCILNVKRKTADIPNKSNCILNIKRQTADKHNKSNCILNVKRITADIQNKSNWILNIIRQTADKHNFKQQINIIYQSNCVLNIIRQTLDIQNKSNGILSVKRQTLVVHNGSICRCVQLVKLVKPWKKRLHVLTLFTYNSQIMWMTTCVRVRNIQVTT